MIKVFEFSSRALENSWMALHRQMSGQTSANSINEFNDLCTTYFSDFFKKITFDKVTSFFDYPVVNFPGEAAKQEKYIRNITKALKHGIFEKGPFVQMVK